MYTYRRPKDPQRKNSNDYRYHLTRDLLTNLHRGECCSVVGVGSCGKSRLMLHLTRPETMEYHLGDGAYDHLIILVECNAFVNDTVWAAYEAMTRSLMEMLDNVNHPALQNARRELTGMYEAVTAPDQRDLAFNHIRTGIGLLLKGTRLKLTFCFDEFDFVFEKFDAQLFRNLRALRNQNKYQLTYLTTTRRQIPYQRPRDQWPDVEEFYELFADNTFAIGPYDEKDAMEMIVDLEARYEYQLKKATRELLYEVTGGHSGLIGASFRLLEQARQQPTTPQQMAQLLVNDQSTWKECRKIWESLRPDECGALKRLAVHGRPGRDDAGLIAELKAKGLVRETNNRGAVEIFSPIMHEFARQSDG
jgi:hypothetical protein